MRISFYFFFLILLIFFGCSKTDSDIVEKNSFHDSTPINLLDESVRNSLAKKAIYFDDLSWSEKENEKAFLSGKLFTGWVKREKETLLGIAQMKDGLEDGPFLFLYSNDNPKLMGSFENGKKSGLWKTWDKDGIITSERRWNDKIFQKLKKFLNVLPTPCIYIFRLTSVCYS